MKQPIQFLLTLLFSCIALTDITYAQSRLDSLEQQLPTLSGKEHVDVLNDLGFNYAFHSIQKAKHYAFKGLNEARNIDYKEGVIRALINVGYSHFDYNHLDSASYYFLEARKSAIKIDDQSGLANSLNALGTVMKSKGDYPEAVKYYKEALNTQEELNSVSGMASAYNNIGDVMRTVGNFDTAISYFLNALKLNRDQNDTRRIALNLINISWVYLDQQNEPMTKKYLAQLDEMKSELKLSNLASMHNMYGLVYVNEQNYDKAVEQFDLAIACNDSLGRNSLSILHNKADLYRRIKAYDKALNLSQDVLAQKLDIGRSQESILMSMDLISDIYFDMHRYDLALQNALKAYQLADSIKSRERQSKAADVIAQAYAQLGQYKAAWPYKEFQTTVRDSIYNAKKVEQQEAMLSLYEAEQNEKTIALQKANLEAQEASLALSKSKNNQLTLGVIATGLLVIIFITGFIKLRKSNKLLALKNQQIAARDHEKEVLLKEIHHRVKNNLQIISSILNIQSRKLDDPIAKKAVAEGRSRIKSMSLIHEKLYSNDQMSVINMKEYIEELSSYLFSTYKPAAEIKKSIETSDLKLDIDTAIPLGLILNELVSNSLKYAFNHTKDGELNISLSQDQETFTLKVADSGAGLPENYMKVKNMGLRLVNSLTEQLDGILDVKNENGAHFTLTFKTKSLAGTN
ncbi:MAG: histidine kinase dimerization/phosphoacceptor domain -containing protein [Fulvivirga sp.]